MAKASKTEVSIAGKLVNTESFVLISDPGSLEALSCNLAGEQLSEWDLDRIKVPGGGGTAWEVPSLEGSKNQDEIRGIILHVGIRKAYWENPNPTGDPPSCFSPDGLAGIGLPGGDCMSCQFNQFGSAIAGDGSARKGKRCREVRMILFIREEDRLPLIIVVPPSSLKNCKQYLMRLPVAMFQAVTRLSLEKVTGGDGPDYSRIVMTYDGHIGSEAAGSLKNYAKLLKQSLTGGQPIASDFSRITES